MRTILTIIQIYMAICFFILVYITYAHELAEAFIFAVMCLIAGVWTEIEKRALK